MISRAQPWLGTLVAIRADGSTMALDEAFRAVALVHRRMSAHSGDSDLARIGRDAHAEPVEVHPWTWEVLACALEMSEASEGSFDVTLRRQGASFRDLELLPENRVRSRKAVRVDLGGIAKGFAVDRAVFALKAHGCSRGSVNAGGDLRVFGDEAQEVRVRLPGTPGVAATLCRDHEAAFATSGSYFGSAQVDARSGNRLCGDYSITVAAHECMHADALTKVVAANGPRADLLARYRARAYLVDAEGRIHASRR
jgi:thiamine biosynthesis lipoprotein